MNPLLPRPSIRALLIDISGTLLIGSSPTPGAVQALAKLRTARIPFRLCSNTSKESSDAIAKRMQQAGFDIHKEELWTSVGALGTVLKELGIKRPYMLLSKSSLQECTDNSWIPDGYSPESDSIPSSLPYDAVVLGLAPVLLDYANLNTAFRILVGENFPRHASESQHYSTSQSSGETPRAGAQPGDRPPLIALHKARYLEASDHALSLGPGPFVRALEDAAGTSALVVGKPTRAFFETVLRDLEGDIRPARGEESDVPSSSSALFDNPALAHPSTVATQGHRWHGIAMIGDDVVADLGEGAIELGLWRVLVKTGKYRAGDESRADVRPPDQVCTSFSEFTEVLLGQQQTQGGTRSLILY